MSANLENSAVVTRLKNLSFHLISKKSNAKECSNYHIIARITHVSKVTIKILQGRFHQYMDWEIPDVKLGLEKAEGSETKLPTSVWSWEKKEFHKKKSTSSSLIKLKPLIVDHNKMWKTLKEMGIPCHLTCLPRKLHVCQEATVRTRYVSNLGKMYIVTLVL